MTSQARMTEIDRNYDFFQRNIRHYLPQHAGQYALLRDESLVAFYPRVGEAAEEARRRFDDGLYSIQQVVEDPIDLGFFSHAGS